MESVSIKIKRTVKEGCEALRHFGWGVASSRIGCIWHNESLKSVQKHNVAILSYLNKEYGDLINEYVALTDPEEARANSAEAPIWVFWMQGKEKLPELIQMCQKSREKAAGQHPIILLDRDNIRTYVAFPEEVWEKAESGSLKVQHLADMIRVQLLRKYGGLWLDASIYCHKEIPERLFEYPVFSLRGEYMPQFVSGNRWTTFLIGGRAGNVLCSFLDDFFQAWIKSGKPFIHYFMFDCAIAVAYENIPEVRKDIEDIPTAKGDCYWLNRHLFETADDELLRAYLEEPAVFYKIARKEPEERNGQSLYAYLLKQNE